MSCLSNALSFFGKDRRGHEATDCDLSTVGNNMGCSPNLLVGHGETSRGVDGLFILHGPFRSNVSTCTADGLIARGDNIRQH
jgi:hypothetical protein